MAYIKTSWVARVGTALNRFLKTNETATEVELTNDPTGVSVPGTPFTVDNMNKIEQGIYDAHEAMGGNFAELDTDGEPTFAKLTLTTSTYGNQTLGAGSSWLVPQGIYQMAPGSASISVEIYNGSLMVGAAPLGGVVSDGINVKVKNTSSVSQTVQYLKFS